MLCGTVDILKSNRKFTPFKSNLRSWNNEHFSKETDVRILVKRSKPAKRKTKNLQNLQNDRSIEREGNKIGSTFMKSVC